MVTILALVLLLVQAGQNDASNWLDGHLYERAMDECVMNALIREVRNGGLNLDSKTGHGAMADAIQERCRKELGVQQRQ